MTKTLARLRLSAALFCISLSSGLLSAATPDVPCAPSSPYVLGRSMVFAGGDSVSKFYRIPAIAVTPQGTIVALADRRLDSNKDLPGRIDVVARRSTDMGATWSPVIEVAVHDGGGGYGDPAVGVNVSGQLVAVMTHGNGLWESTGPDHASLMASVSSDDGLTWTAPHDITGCVFSHDGSAPVSGTAEFATSGRIETASDGSMWFVMVTHPDNVKWGPLYVYPVVSRDGGQSWSSVPVAVDTDGDESKIVERRDGSLLMSVRNRRKGGRKFAASTDGALTWSPVEISASLPDPACNGDIVRYTHGGRDILLHSIPDHASQRRNVSVFASADDGASWSKVITVCPVGSAYSSMAVLPDGTLGILTEEDSSLGGYRLWFTRINIEPLL